MDTYAYHRVLCHHGVQEQAKRADAAWQANTDVNSSANCFALQSYAVPLGHGARKSHLYATVCILVRAQHNNNVQIGIFALWCENVW